MAELLNISNLTVEYMVSSGVVHALTRVTVGIPSSGYTLGVVGESGSGKSTLGISILNAIESPGFIRRGKIEWQGKNILAFAKEELRKYRWQEVSMVYQSAMNSLNPVKTASNHISEVIVQHSQVPKSEARRRAIELLSQVGISEKRANAYPHELSGGMRQRVGIAMALALSPKLLIADEPTSALDVVVQKQLITLLKGMVRARGLSLMFITHEIALLSGLVDNIIVLYSGELVERGPSDKVLRQPLHPYTEMLLGSVLIGSEDLLKHERRSLAEIRRAYSPNSCVYADRCKYVFDRCRKEKPVLKEAQDGRWVACHKFN